MSIHDAAQAAQAAAIHLAAADAQCRNRALAAIAEALKHNQQAIVAANQEDLQRAEEANLAAPLRKRLRFDAGKLEQVCQGIESLMELSDPLGQTLQATQLDEGLELYKISCPIGVIGVIFESRPDALVQISTLCLKSANAVLLKGGSEAAATNKILAQIIAQATERTGIPAGWIQLMETRQDVTEMLSLDKAIDLVIPRGSNEFVQHIMSHTHIPVLGHADGICHVYVDQDVDQDMAVRIAVDSKCQYVAVCNAAETLLVHAELAPSLLPRLEQALKASEVEIRGCARTASFINCVPAQASDWSTEYLDLVLSVKIVDSLHEAIEHINTYGSGHTDSILTNSEDHAQTFMNLVDSGNVFWNCSTRFSDGFRYGLGAEVGVSTHKIHARGPVGLEGLMIYKWKLIGKGQTVADYSAGLKRFCHTPLDKDCPLA